MKSVTNWFWFKRLSSSEHRKAQRMKSPLLVAYYWDGASPTSHTIRNISSTGFYLATKERWLPGTMVTMTLQRTDIALGHSGTEPHIAVLTKVVRLDEEGVGFTFVPLEAHAGDLKSKPVDRKTLVRFLEQLKLDRGRAIIGHIEATLKTKLSGQNSGSAIPWRERYEETEG
jgi:PilZ domain